jgi:hypothetical protein
MRKTTAAILMAMSSVCLADNSLLIGEWQCKFTSEIIDADEVFTVNPDATYKLAVNLFGSELVDIGKWSVSGNELVLHREAHIAGGKKEPSDHTSTHSITTLENNKLVFTKGQGISTCTK